MAHSLNATAHWLGELRHSTAAVREAIGRKDTDALDRLLSERSQVVAQLLASHATEPVPAEDAEKIMAEHAELTALAARVRDEIREDMRESRSRAAAVRAYEKSRA